MPFGLSCAPLIMQTTVAYLRWKGCRLTEFIDDLPFAQFSLAASMRQAGIMLHELEAFGWLVNPDTCVGLHSEVQIFKSLGTQVDLLQQKYFMTP